MNRRRVLVVEDEPMIAAAVADRLRAESFDVDVRADGPSAVSAFTDETSDAPPGQPFDIVVLDVMLPGFDGLEVCRRLHAVRPVPVLMLTARDAETDILVGLGVGADDYLTKPFSMRELVARVHVLLRRVERATPDPDPAASSAEPVLLLDGLEISPSERRVRVEGAEVHLTRTEFELLICLAARPRTVLGRDQQLAAVWGWAGHGSTRTVDSHVKALRRKLGGDRIRTVHGVGYALDVAR
jgi:DNA-binding response OmpR family regulator